jgi:hypothetical protein
VVALVGTGLVAGSLMFAGPAAARSGGGHGDAGPGEGGHVTSVSAFHPGTADSIRTELPIAPVGETAPSGTAGSGRVPMTGDVDFTGKDAQRNN